MNKQLKQRWINQGRLLVDLAVSITLLAMLLLWSGKYLLSGAPLLLQVEVWAGGDKPLHFSLGFLLPLCLGWLCRIYRQPWGRQLWFFLLIALCYAFDESLQSLLPFRDATWADFQQSVSGWALALVVWYCLWQLLFLPTRQH